MLIFSLLLATRSRPRLGLRNYDTYGQYNSSKDLTYRRHKLNAQIHNELEAR